MAGKKEIIEALAFGEGCRFEWGDDSWFCIAKNAELGKEENPWYEITILWNYNADNNSAEAILNIDENPHTAEEIMEIMQHPMNFQWRDCGGALI